MFSKLLWIRDLAWLNQGYFCTCFNNIFIAAESTSTPKYTLSIRFLLSFRVRFEVLFRGLKNPSTSLCRQSYKALLAGAIKTRFRISISGLLFSYSLFRWASRSLAVGVLQGCSLVIG